MAFKYLKLLNVLILSLTASCGMFRFASNSDEIDGVRNASGYEMSLDAYVYLNQALEILQENHINREQIEWDGLKKRAFDNARGSNTTASTYLAIRFAVAELDDPHTNFISPEAVSASSNDFQFMPHVELIQEQIGYVNLPSCCSGDTDIEYAEKAQEVICEAAAASNICGWIVDLTTSTGGAMFPLLVGIGPILGEGIAGGFRDSEGDATWEYRNGKGFVEGEIWLEINRHACNLQEAFPPVAVITGQNTTSAGEAIVVAFRGRPNTTSFGQPTRGLSSGVRTFELSDGAKLAVKSSLFFDRTRTVYGQQIVPDNLMRLGSGARADAVLDAASLWLVEQPQCIQ